MFERKLLETKTVETKFSEMIDNSSKLSENQLKILFEQYQRLKICKSHESVTKTITITLNFDVVRKSTEFLKKNWKLFHRP